MKRDVISGAPTNILYTKQALRNADGSVSEGSSFSIHIKGAEVGKYINIADTELCFSLDIPLVGGGNANAWIPNNSVLDLFEVQSVQIDGLNLNLSKQFDSDMFVYKIMQNLDNGEEDRKIGFYKPEKIEELAQVGVAGDGTVSQPDGRYYAVTASLATQFTLRSNSGFSRLASDPKRFIYSYENGRKLRQMSRQYVVAQTGVITALGADDVAQKTYSIKLGQLCPQLAKFSLVDAEKLLARGGLIINLKLLDSPYCMSGFLLEKTSDVVGVLTLLELNTRANYSIDNIYLGVVQHMESPEVRLSMMQPQPTPFLTFYQFSDSLTATTYNRLFAIPQSCMVRGLVMNFYAPTKTLIATGVNGATCVIPNKATWTTEQPVFSTGQRNYSQFVKIDQVRVMLNGEQYPKAQNAVTNQPLYLQSHQFSREIFGRSYSPQYEQFMTTDFAVFVPINRIVDSASNFQVSLQFPFSQTGKQVHITVVCDRTLSYENGMVSIK